MRTCDWKELKEGDIFDIPTGAGTGWRDTLGIYRDLDTLFMIKNQCICSYPGVYTLARHYTHPHVYTNCKGVSQAVQVFETPADIPAARLMLSLPRANATTGSDPEIFVVRGITKKTLLPAYKFLPTQTDASKVNDPAKMNSGCSSYHPNLMAFPYRDGFAAECFVQPVSCHGYLIDFIRNGLGKVLRAAREFDRTAKLTIKNSFTIPSVTMDATSDEDAGLGCMPSQNAYDDAPELPANGRDFKMRFAGGHVHMGINNLSKDDAVSIAKACDVIAAIPAVGIFASIDTPVRRQFYGRAGEYRKPKHGFEYRTLSNAWLATPQITHLIMNLVRCGTKIGKSALNKHLPIREEEAREIINFCDVKGARKFVKDNAEIYNAVLKGDGILRTPQSQKAFQSLVAGGIEEMFPGFEDVEANWRLMRGTWREHSDNLTMSWETSCVDPSSIRKPESPTLA